MLQEFHLRSIDAGLNGAATIAEFLNLPPQVSRLTMAELLRDGYIYPKRSSGSNTETAYTLTDDGRALLDTWEATIAVEKVVSFQFDSLLGSPAHYPRELITTARQADFDGLLCLPVLSDGPPEIGPEDTTAFRRAFTQAQGTGSATLISLIQTEGTYETKYLVATGYLFESTDDDHELALRVVIDGRISDQHDTAVLEHRLVDELKIPIHVDESRRQVDNLLGSEAVAARVSDVEVASLLSQLALASNEAHDSDLAPESSRAALAQAEKTEERLTELRVRRMNIQEQGDLWPAAAKLAAKSLMIISDHLEGEFWHEVVEQPIRECLSRGVGVFVGYRSSTFWSPVNGKQQRVPDVMAALKSEFETFSIEHVQRNGANAVVIDNDTVIVSKYSWLARSGQMERRFTDDRGTVVRQREFLDGIVKRIRTMS